MGLIIDGMPAHDLILDGSPVSLYEGGNPPVKVWPEGREVVTLSGAGLEPRDQLRAALSARGLNYRTVTELPFDLDTSQVTSMLSMFNGCSSLTTVPDLDTSQVTNMNSMFGNCSSLTTVPDLDTSSVTNVGAMFYGCSALTDGSVRLIRTSGTKPATRTNMIVNSGLTREPFFLPNGTPIP